MPCGSLGHRGSNLNYIQKPLFLFLNHRLRFLFPLCHALSEKENTRQANFPTLGNVQNLPSEDMLLAGLPLVVTALVSSSGLLFLF